MRRLNNRDLELALRYSVAVASLRRGFVYFFLHWAFQVLHSLDQPLRNDWYLQAMCQALQKTALGRTRRLVINVPPRHLKSIAATAYTAWMLGHNPALKVMLATYGDKLGRDHLERLQRLMCHPAYMMLFPKTGLVPGGISQGVLHTTAGGNSRSVTVGGATTGFGADIILIDDAMNALDIVSEAKRSELDRFYSATLLTRLNSKRRGVIISIQQRLGEDDLPARLIDAGAEHLSLAAFDDQEHIYDIGFGRRYRRRVGEVLRPFDEPRGVLDRLRDDMGPRDFATQYLQLPSALDGNIIPMDRLHRFVLTPFVRSQWEKIVQSWDTAHSENPKAAYSVGITFGLKNGKWYVLDVHRVRLRFAALRDRIQALHKRYCADLVIIEDADSGAHLWDDLRGKMRLIMPRPIVDKETRMVGQLTMIEDGTVLFPTEAPWLDVLFSEMRIFPVSRFKDQIDALAQFLYWAKAHHRSHVVPRDANGRKLYVNRRETVTRR